MDVRTADADSDPRSHLRRRYDQLTEVLEDVSAERSLTLYLAHRRGLDAAEIADVIRSNAASVEKTLDTYRRDEDADTYEEGPRWVALWPKNGWGATF